MSLCIVYILVAVFDTLYKLILSRSQNFSSFVTGNVLYMIVLNREIHLVGVVVYGARKGSRDPALVLQHTQYNS